MSRVSPPERLSDGAAGKAKAEEAVELNAHGEKINSRADLARRMANHDVHAHEKLVNELIYCRDENKRRDIMYHIVQAGLGEHTEQPVEKYAPAEYSVPNYEYKPYMGGEMIYPMGLPA